MSNCNATNLSVTTNTVVIQDVNRRIDIVVPNCETIVTVTQPVTNVITIAVPGPQGITGPPGADADITGLNAFTGSIQSQVNNLAAATSSYVLNAQTASMSVLSSSFAVTASYVTGSIFYDGNLALSASYAISASFASTASYVNPLHQNVIITGSLFVTQSHISTVDYIDFTVLSAAEHPVHTEGRIHWLDDTKTLQVDTDVNNFSIELGHQNVVRVRNVTGNDLTIGKIVYINGESGNRPTIVTASWDGDPTSAATLGFTAQQINDNQTGYVVTNGLLRGINTNAFSPGTQLYLSSSGDYTSTIPISPKHEVRLGKTVTQATDGVIYVDIMNGYEIGELHDVLITNSFAGDLIIRSGSLWINSKQLTGSYGLTGSLNIISGGITGSLLGTASFATTSATSSFVTASNVYGPFGANSVISASYATTSSFALVALNAGSSFPFTGSAIISGSLSVIGPVSFTGSFAVSSSAGTTLFTSNADTLIVTGSLLVTGSINLVGLLVGTASYALTASYIDGGFY